MTEPHDPTSDDRNQPEETRTGIIRRAPTGPLPASPAVRHRPAAAAGGAPRHSIPSRGPTPSAAVPVAACAVAILSGWATSVVATDLIVGWWATNRLFCIAVGFLALVFAAATICGVLLLLRQRPTGRYLIAIGAAVGFLTFISVFIARARVPWIVHAIPVLQVTSAVLALHPATKRWLRD